MKFFRVTIVILFISALSNAAFADKDKRKDETQGTTVAEPDCEFTSAREHL